MSERQEALQWLKADTKHYIDVCHEDGASQEEDNRESISFVHDFLKAGALKVEIVETDPEEGTAEYVYVTMPDPIPKPLLATVAKWKPDDYHEEELNVWYMYWDLH